MSGVVDSQMDTLSSIIRLPLFLCWDILENLLASHKRSWNSCISSSSSSVYDDLHEYLFSSFPSSVCMMIYVCRFLSSSFVRCRDSGYVRNMQTRKLSVAQLFREFFSITLRKLYSYKLLVMKRNPHSYPNINISNFTQQLVSSYVGFQIEGEFSVFNTKDLFVTAMGEVREVGLTWITSGTLQKKLQQAKF